MGQTKKKRRSKHRGTAAGTIEARGRTGRKPPPQDPKEARRVAAREKRATRLDRPPTWRGAAQRAGIAAALFFVAILIFFDQPVSGAVSLAAFMLLLYIPMGYYTDLFIYNRRQRRKAEGEGA
jgi:hypothetical protein